MRVSLYSPASDVYCANAEAQNRKHAGANQCCLGKRRLEAPSDEKLSFASSLLIAEWTQNTLPVFLVSSDFVWDAALHLFGFCNKDKDLASRLTRGCKVCNPFVHNSLLSRSY